MDEYIVIGSGISALGVVLELIEKNINPIVLDIGIEKDKDFLSIQNNNCTSPRLNDPQNQYVTYDLEKDHKISNFRIVKSYALGGLANIWGGGLFECSDKELEKLKIQKSEIEPFYKKAYSYIDIYGDMNANHLFRDDLYIDNETKYLLNKNKSIISKASIALKNNNILNPKDIWKNLINERKITYYNNHLVSRINFTQKNIMGKNIKTKEMFIFDYKKVYIAAGVFSTSKIILSSNNDEKTELSILDNHSYQIPLLIPKNPFSKKVKNKIDYAQLKMNFKDSNYNFHGSIFNLSTIRKDYIIPSLPFKSKLLYKLLTLFFNGPFLLYIFKDSSEACAYLSLNGIKATNKLSNKKILKIIKRNIKTIFPLFHPIWIKRLPKGQSIHYGGSLPMSNDRASLKYSCDFDGKLKNQSDIYICDGSSFPYIPATNYSFTLFANAMRIAKKSLKENK